LDQGNHDAETRAASDGATTRVRITGLSKTFPGTRALEDVSMEIAPGAIHALVGGNGSGKSTLIKILAGVYQADRGTIEIEGVQTDADSITPAHSYDAGIRVVHQDLGIFPSMNVEENLALGSTFKTGRGGWIRHRAMRRRTRELIDRFDIPARPTTQLAELGRAGQTLVAIARALQGEESDHGGLLILDEPTAALPAHEVEMLLQSLKRYAAEGQSILYISHRLDEVMSCSDRVSVLRDGRMAGTYPTAELDENRLIELIVGRRLDRVFPERRDAGADRETVLEVEDLVVGPVRGASLQVKRGEILGIAGLLGSGRSEILRAIFGDMRRRGGIVRFAGKEVEFSHPGEAMVAGVAFVPENRAEEAAFADLSVGTNISLTSLRRYWNRAWLSDRRLRRDASLLMSEYLVKADSQAALLETLSGGNQQKVMIARWLRREPQLLLLDEPTQGVDVGARAEIYKFVRRATEAGAGAVIVASDFEELVHAADRIVVLRDGVIVADRPTDQVDADEVTRLAMAMEEEKAYGN
jgi:ribose transport system ATP-binding protein